MTELIGIISFLIVGCAMAAVGSVIIVAMGVFMLIMYLYLKLTGG